MRLKPSPQSQSEGVATGDQSSMASSSTERKRSRPTSSLDIKVDEGDHMIRLPTPAELHKEAQLQQEKKMQRSSRPRGGRNGGIPNLQDQKFDIESMSQEELLDALINDPELSAYAQALGHDVPPKKPRRSSRSSRTKRTKRATPHVERDYLKERQEKGVPVFQWIAVLLIIGVLLYQLRKTLFGSLITTTSTKSNKNVSGRNNKSTKQYEKKLGRNKARAHVAPSPIEQELEQEILVQVPAAVSKKIVSTKKKKSRKSKSTKKPKKDANELPDSVSTDGSSSTDPGNHDAADTSAPAASPASKKVIVDTSVAAPAIIEQDGWQTVGIKTEVIPEDASVHAASSTSEEKKDDIVVHPITPDNSPRILLHQVEEAVEESKYDEDDDEIQPPPGFVAAAATPDKKKKKNKQKKNKQKVVSSAATTDQDEAIALRLQKEEERLHKSSLATAPEEIWEEVATTKKKNRA